MGPMERAKVLNLLEKVNQPMGRNREARWRMVIQRGLAPVTVGLMFSSGYVLSRASDHSLAAYAVTAATAALMLWTRAHPLLVLAAAAVLGGFGLI